MLFDTAREEERKVDETNQTPSSNNILSLNVHRFSMSDIDSNKYINYVRMKKKLNKVNYEETTNKLPTNIK